MSDDFILRTDTSRSAADSSEPRQPNPGDIAWLVLLPCAAVTVAAILLLGQPLGNVLSSIHEPIEVLPSLQQLVFAKYAEQARFLIALTAPGLLVAMTLALTRRPPALAPTVVGALTIANQLAALAFVAVCVWAQHVFAYGTLYGFPISIYPHGFVQPYFTLPTLAVGMTLALLPALAIKRDVVFNRLARAISNPGLGIGTIAVAVAILVTATWILAGVNFEHTVGGAGEFTWVNVGVPLDEVFAVLDGRSPLVNFTPQYGELWPYPIALVMSVFGTSFGVFSMAMCTLTGISLLAIFDVLRRITGSSLGALVLYLPFLATSLFAMQPGLVYRHSPLTLYSDFPFRYGGPYILLWCFVRQVKSGRARLRWAVFTVGGLVVVNNVEFGVAAFAATFVGMLLIESPLRLKRLGGLVRDALTGVLATYALLSILTLLRAGSLPRLSHILLYDRIYGGAQYYLLPTPTLGLHIVIYLSYVAAIAVAGVRTIGRDSDRLLTGALAWSGVFGLGAGSYFMGRSHPEVLVPMFSAWSLALVLLAIAAAKQIARDPRRRLTPARFAAFMAVGVAACSLAQVPLPWTQIQRLQRRTTPVYVASGTLEQTLLHYGGGRPEAIMSMAGHRLGYEMGIEDVSPYAGIALVYTVGQVEDIFRALHSAGGSLLVLPNGETPSDVYVAVCEAGFNFIETVDANFGPAHVLSLWSAPVPGIAPRSCPVG